MDAEWKWDKTLFGGSARYYRAGRFPYPAELATALQEELSLDGRGRLLDVGSGIGEIALLLAPLYDEVVGLDADEDMVATAREEALRRGHRNTTWVNARAEELPLDLGTFRTATFAQSFHWMDRQRVTSTVFEMLEPDGAWVHVDTKTHRGAETNEQLSHPQPSRDRGAGRALPGPREACRAGSASGRDAERGGRDHDRRRVRRATPTSARRDTYLRAFGGRDRRLDLLGYVFRAAPVRLSPRGVRAGHATSSAACFPRRPILRGRADNRVDHLDSTCRRRTSKSALTNDLRGALHTL